LHHAAKRDRHNGSVLFLLAPIQTPPAVIQTVAPAAKPTPDEALEPANRLSHYLYVFYDQAALFLGSADQRYGSGVGFGYGKPEPKFRYGEIVSQVVYEGYIDQTSSLSNFNAGNRNTVGIGGIAMGRWFWPKDAAGRSMFFDLGMGVQYGSHTTFDLDSEINTTPVLGVGALFPVSGGREISLGLRLLHISNGGTHKPNHGQNEILFMLGLRF